MLKDKKFKVKEVRRTKTVLDDDGETGCDLIKYSVNCREKRKDETQNKECVGCDYFKMDVNKETF